MSGTTQTTNTSKAAPAFSGSAREGVVEGNTSSAAGARGGAPEQPTLSEQMGITMPADTRIVSNERETLHTEANPVTGDSTSTAGPGGDARHRVVHEHEMKGMKQRLENDDERASREALGKDEPITEARKPTDTVN